MKSRITLAATLLLLAGLTACGSESDGKSAEATSPSTSTPAATASKDSTQEFRDWADSGGTDTLATILTDLAAVQEASDPVNLDGLRKSCPTMTANLEVAKQSDTMPGPAGQRWTLALEHLAASAAACSEGAVSGDQADFDLMASEMDIGISHITAVNKHLDEALGS